MKTKFLLNIILSLLFSFSFLYLQNVSANYDYVCSTYVSECRNVQWEKNPDLSLRFRDDGSNHGFGTKIIIKRYGNTRVGCPSSSRAYGTVAFGPNGGYNYGDKQTSTQACELKQYDTSAPDLTIGSINNFQDNGALTGYTGSIPCDMSNGASNSSCTSQTNTGGTVIGYTGSIPCTISNGASNPTYCTAVYEKVNKYSVSASCRDDNGNILPGAIGNSGCNYSSSILASVTKNAGEIATFKAVDKAGNFKQCNTNNTCTTGVACLSAGNCITVDPPTNDACIDSNNPVGKITYSINTCTNKDVTVTNTCISDATCGCRPAPEDKAIAPSIPINSSNTLGIADKAGNITDLPWSINWIDKVVPYNVQFVTATQKASPNNFYVISAQDNAPEGLCNDPYLSYELTITGPENKVLTGKIKYDGTPITGLLGLTKIGTYSLSLQVKDQAGNIVVKNNIPNIGITPADLDASATTISVASTTDKYADNTSSYIYTIFLRDKYGNPIANKTLNSITQDCGGTACKKISINMVQNTGGDAMSIFNYTGVKSDASGKISFNVKSLTPGVFSQSFQINMNKWDDNYQDIGTTQSIIKSLGAINSFKKPFSGQLQVSKDDGVTWGASPEIGTNLNYRLLVSSISSLLSNSFVLDDFKDDIKVIDAQNTTLQSLTSVTGLTTRTAQFSARINTSLSATGLGVPGIQISDNTNQSSIIISYNLGGYNVKYYLSSDEIGDSRKVIKAETLGDSFIGAKIIGNLQSTGKAQITGQKANISDLSKNDLRTTIRKNAYQYILNMKSGDTVGGVKYVEGNVILSGNNLGYDTLIVKNGNVTISGDLNTTNKILGIIVLKDNYNINTDYAGNGNIYIKPNVKDISAFIYAGNGNIYIKPNVKDISAFIYADGGVISVNSSGQPYLTDSTTRTADLKNQLVLQGSLFTRNTIGGAILSGGQYLLPGGSKTNDFDKAMIYDLNYLRRGNSGCDNNSNAQCSDTGEYKDGFVIKYDSRIQSTPPKLFK